MVFSDSFLTKPKHSVFFTHSTLPGNQVALPVLHINFSLAIYFIHESVYLPMPLSPFAPLFPSLTGSTVYSLYLRLHSFLAHEFISTIFLDSIYVC